MSPDWDDNQPIYRQLYQRIQDSILDGSLPEGQPIPSVRNIAAELQLNPITVSRAYQLLVDDGLVEKRRGLGMFVRSGARARLSRRQQERFLLEDWPQVLLRIRQLGLDPGPLIEQLRNLKHGENDP